MAKSTHDEVGNDIPKSISPYLDEIAERLWSGRAAAMVGAGFSKNASEKFPSWNELGDIFFEKLHGRKPDTGKQRYLNVSQLAEEVDAAIGRPALENLLQATIPDLDISPSPLHADFLKLPWVDVFTTNYDTLLERASDKVVARRYEPVINKEDIPYATKPRIVKLHGSFPSERPFIITEEDYRLYPRDYAPFVNTVRQSLLENTFCLIGFSGDDPNFYQWISWISDNLGTNKTQRVYLVGILDLSPTRLQLLAQRGITVVDLSCFPDVDKHDHGKALAKFFDYLNLKNPAPLEWPRSTANHTPSQGGISLEDIQQVTNDWRKQRESYPGWPIPPRDIRQQLWHNTREWTNCIPDGHDFRDATDLHYVFELIWRLDRCLLPLPDHIAEYCGQLLDKYWPFPAHNPPENCLVSVQKDECQHLPWDEIQREWLTTAFAMLRYCRESGIFPKWNEIEKKFEKLNQYFSPEQKELFSYEKFLFNLSCLDISEVKLCLENWKPNESQPHWMIKCAAAHAEFGSLNKAKTMISEALQSIRRKLNQRVSSSDVFLASIEDSAMLLSDYIQNNNATQHSGEKFLQPPAFENETRQIYNQRNMLGSKLDLRSELTLFDSALQSLPSQRGVVVRKPTFDIGRVTHSIRFLNADEEVIFGYSFLRFREEIGLPFRIGRYIIGDRTAENALSRIARHYPFWATATAIRLGTTEVVDKLFNRESVFRFTTEEADWLIQRYLNALTECKNDIHTGEVTMAESYGLRLARILPEVISRLCCKCSHDVKLSILKFIAELYGSPDKSKYSNIRGLAERLMESLDNTEQYNFIPELLRVPFPDDPGPKLREFINLFWFLGVRRKPTKTEDFNISDTLVHRLLQRAGLADEGSRRWAISSLTRLHELHLLSDEQSMLFGEAIWGMVDQNGLPDRTDFFNFHFLLLPHPQTVDPIAIFKRYVDAEPFPLQKESTSLAITGGIIGILFDIIGAKSIKEDIWDSEDAKKFLRRAAKWWDADKHHLKKEDRSPLPSSPGFDEFRNRFSRMARLLAEVVGPNLTPDVSDDAKHSLNRLLDEMYASELPVLAAKVASLHLLSEQENQVYSQIQGALTSAREHNRFDALEAIFIAIRGNTSSAEPEAMLRQYLTWCSDRSLQLALDIVIRILDELPNSFSPSLEQATLARLDRLILETSYDNKDFGLDFDQRLQLRKVTSVLAGTLWKHYKSNKAPMPPVIEKWREICLSPDEFAEIRVAWNNSSSP